MRIRPLSLLCLLVLAAPVPAADITAQLAKEMARETGTSWFGVYFHGKGKCGCARITVRKDAYGKTPAYVSEMMMDVTIQMGAAKQKLSTTQTRYYALGGKLLGFDSDTRSILGKMTVAGVVKGDKLELVAKTAGHTNKKTVPAPDESLETILAAKRLIQQGKPGDTIQFQVFEASLTQAVNVTAKLVRFEDRVINGVKTRIGVVESSMKELGMTSTEYVTTDGDLIETTIAGMFTLRKEPEKIAKDVRHAFDALRAGIIPVKKRLGRPHNIVSLKLKVSGVRKDDLLIDDARQTYQRNGTGQNAVHTVTILTARQPAKPATLPLTLTGELKKHLEPSLLAQSDAPDIIAAAKKIVGNETDAFKAAAKIERWVYKNVKKKGLAALSNALAVLKRKEGDCSEHSILFVALCRAAGIPTRLVTGIGYAPSMKGFGYHAWGEVYVGEWVAMDPTWGETLADATHLKFGVGDTRSLGAVAGLFGTLKLQVLDVKRK